jgi:hypothetical protein
MAAKKKTTDRREGADDDFPDFATGEEFDALSDADKEKVSNYYSTHRKLRGLRPLPPAEQRRLQTEQTNERRKMGRPVIGKGSVNVAITVERDLLERADAYARAHGLKRTQLIAKGLELAMKKGAA